MYRFPVFTNMAVDRPSHRSSQARQTRVTDDSDAVAMLADHVVGGCVQFLLPRAARLGVRFAVLRGRVHLYCGLAPAACLCCDVSCSYCHTTGGDSRCRQHVRLQSRVQTRAQTVGTELRGNDSTRTLRRCFLGYRCLLVYLAALRFAAGR
jgi:hypothetical protein